MSRSTPIPTGAGHDFDLRIGTDLTPDHVEFLVRTVWGSGDLRYRIPDLGERLRRLRAPYVFAATRGEELVSICILDRCRKRVFDRDVDAIHIVMVATREDLRNTGIGGRVIEAVKAFCDRELERPGIGYAYVESTTDITLRISENIGHTLEAEMPLTLFSRFWPSDDGAAVWADAADRPEIVARLRDLYADHALTDFGASVDPARTLLLHRDGRILAAVQVEDLVWSLVSLPGLTGRFLLRLMPWIPCLRGRLNPERLPILKFTNLLVEPGQEASFMRLMNAALARRNASLAMMLLDARSPVLKRIRRTGRFGLLSHAVRGSALMHLDLLGMSDAEIGAIANKPLVSSAADIF